MRFTYLLVFLCSFCYVALAHSPVPATLPKVPVPPPKLPPPHPPPQWPGLPPPEWPGSPPGTCPQPSEQTLRCLREWACQYIIRLDLRCLLNLNGNPLLGNLIAIPGVTGGGGGSGGGLLGNLLGK